MKVIDNTVRLPSLVSSLIPQEFRWMIDAEAKRHLAERDESDRLRAKSAEHDRLAAIEASLRLLEGKLVTKKPAVQPATRKLRGHKLKVWRVIQHNPGLRSSAYCRALEKAGVHPPKSFLDDGCPNSYPKAYLKSQAWRHRINDEKSRITRMALSEFT